MIPSVYEKLHITPGVSAVIVSLALMLIAGFAMTRLTSKLRLPNVTAYIVSGILLGPFCLDLVPRGVIDGMSFSPTSRSHSSLFPPASFSAFPR